jgi:hypothetical protein
MHAPTPLKLFAASALALLVNAAPAPAAAVVNFVSAAGNDANPCSSRAAPCRTLQRAINQTYAGGEVRVLSDLPAQITYITRRSVTVNGGGQTLIGPIVINNAAAIVTLRDLHLSGRHASQHGISVLRALAVHIEECTTERFVQNGIRIQPATAAAMEVFVSDTVSRDNHDGLSVFGNANTKLTVDNSRFENNSSTGLYSSGGGSASVSRSVSSGNGLNGIVLNSGTMNVTNTTVASNTQSGLFVANGEMTVFGSTSRGNGNAGLFLVGAAAAIAHSVFTGNNIGIDINGSTVVSLDIDPGADVNPGDHDLRSNVIDGNATADVDGAIARLAGM